MRKIRRWGAWLLLIIPLALNAQQRTEKLLNVPLPEHWQEEDAMFQQQLPVDDHWWTVFQDATLDSLIHVAVRQNPSVLTALNRIDMAKANLRIARGGYYPALSLDARWNRQQTSGNTGTGQPQSRVGYYDATVNMSWQVDVFGSIRQRVKAQKENFAASREEYNATMVSLCAEVASAYFNLREAQQELSVLQRNALSQKAVVDITEVRYNTGLASKLDVAQAKSVYYSTFGFYSCYRIRYYSIYECVGCIARALSSGCDGCTGNGKTVTRLYRAGRGWSSRTITFTTSRCTGCRTSSQCTSSPVGSF